MGTPAPSADAEWCMLRSVVAGRVINMYSTNDYVLGFLYRSQSITLGVAGLQAVENVKGVENVDVSSLVSGHTRYRFLTGPILKQIGFEDVDMEGLEEEANALKEQDEKEEKEQDQNEQKDKFEGDDVSERYVDGLQKEVEKKNEQSYIGWAQSKMVAAGSSVSAAYGSAAAQWRQKSVKPVGAESSGSRTEGAGEQAPEVPARPS